MEEEKNIPQEILEEILVKLPVKSLSRFKAVTREWRGTIESTYFVEKHVLYQKSLGGSQASIMALSMQKTDDGVHGLLLVENILCSAKGIIHGSPYLPIKAFRSYTNYKISEPCDGMFCLYTKNTLASTNMVIIVNPASTSLRTLPNPIGIGRENSVSRRYKLVWFYEVPQVNIVTKCKVFALGSNTWKVVHPPHCRLHYYNSSLMHLDGIMYCLIKTHDEICNAKVLAFDLHTEKFQTFSITLDVGEGCELSMCVLNHRLCVFKRFADNNDTCFKIWGLDISKTSVEIMYSIDFSCLPPDEIEWEIVPMATINNCVVISSSHLIHSALVRLYGSKSNILYPTASHRQFIPYFESLVSPYQ
ncbi:unnamed protein product [Microthlaspi erraticum]|uniref:F-box domain-containing protein n=1 Tax=Microthlaspi erraticum TaxID=1685480 RepID=A0A6D2KCH9_9BRAS|nr:unnamed protein product [Microthlaspi erraticum]